MSTRLAAYVTERLVCCWKLNKGLTRELQRLDRAGSGTAPQSGVRTAILRFLITSMPRPDLEALIGLSGAESDGALDYAMFLD